MAPRPGFWELAHALAPCDGWHPEARVAGRALQPGRPCRCAGASRPPCRAVAADAGADGGVPGGAALLQLHDGV